MCWLIQEGRWNESQLVQHLSTVSSQTVLSLLKYSCDACRWTDQVSYGVWSHDWRNVCLRLGGKLSPWLFKIMLFFSLCLSSSLSLFQIVCPTKISLKTALFLLRHRTPDKRREELKINMLIHSSESPSVLSLCSKQWPVIIFLPCVLPFRLHLFCSTLLVKSAGAPPA